MSLGTNFHSTTEEEVVRYTLPIGKVRKGNCRASFIAVEIWVRGLLPARQSPYRKLIIKTDTRHVSYKIKPEATPGEERTARWMWKKRRGCSSRWTGDGTKQHEPLFTGSIEVSQISDPWGLFSTVQEDYVTNLSVRSKPTCNRWKKRRSYSKCSDPEMHRNYKAKKGLNK